VAKNKPQPTAGNNNMTSLSHHSRTILETLDRELARVFVAIFQPMGGKQHIAVVFANESLAERARTSWKGDSGAECHILCAGRRKLSLSSSKKRKKPMEIAAKLAAEVENDSSSGPLSLPDGIEVALFVAPGPNELLVVQNV
jgi:hypothetical protein